MAKQPGLPLNLPAWVDSAKLESPKALPRTLASAKAAASAAKGLVLYVSPDLKKPADVLTDKLADKIREELPFLTAWQLKRLESKDDVLLFDGAEGPVWVLRPEPARSHDSLSRRSPYARGRDALGSLVAAFVKHKLAEVEIRFHGSEPEEEHGAITGLEIASYRFAENMPRQGKKKPERTLPSLRITRHSRELDASALRSAARAGRAVNIARHLVNLPPYDLNPKTYGRLVEELFEGSRTVKVETWDKDRLKEERCTLMLAVGSGGKEGPRLVRMSYRPKGSGKAAKGQKATTGAENKAEGKAEKKSEAPIAFVGKGITFDTGGLDIKPSAGMRLMKKDMGGSAALVGLCAWAEATEYPRPLDFYLALAENGVDADSFHPSDIVLARNGTTVEIDNTDAEGRLVLADALDVALQGTEAGAPQAIIDVATLTGAGKVSLGAEIASLFANDDKLAGDLQASGLEAGDLCWRMPLYQGYVSKLKSHFADTSNSGDSMGGAITAALFLEKFVGKVSWAHLDIYAWQDSPNGALSAVGGSGQPVQCLIRFLESRRA